jgi:hypothetical protein
MLALEGKTTVKAMQKVVFEQYQKKIESEISNAIPRNMCNILVMRDLNARISNRADFIINENRDNEPLDRLLPDNYNIDYNIHRYSDRNTQNLLEERSMHIYIYLSENQNDFYLV